LESEHRKLSALILASAILVMVVLSRSVFLGAPVPKVSALTVESDLGVYWDRSCSHSVSHIDWGRLSPGQVRDVVVYVRNEGNETFVLVLTPLNWNPENASHYLSLALNCEDRKIEVGQVAAVTLSLSVSPSITGVYDFGFDMVLEGREFFLGDVNRDGSVNILDVAALKVAWGSTPADSNWNPRANLNRDGVVDLFDILLLRNDFGKSW
jgi:hypothetical protein